MIRLALALLLIAGAARAARAPETLADPAQEAHARALQKEFRCLVCQGESIDESNAPLAADLRRLIREHIARGESDDEIRRYLVARYGEFILMKPPLETDTYALWFAPILVLLAGGAVAALVIRHARTAAREHPLGDL
ncbi:MAG TPA: cytochrome c-type biogenesis protein [Rhizomicrobium sp.]|nr:cytochrome c-type biogenesis protein [Rhizomicrobium sp.]